MIRQIANWLRRSDRGTVAIELALVTPIFLILLMAGVEVTRFVLLNQKIERASATMADLVAQSEALAEGDLGVLFDATRFVMEPFDMENNGNAIVSSISATGSSAAKVNWKRTYGGGAGSCSVFGSEGGLANLPGSFQVRDGESIVVTEICYEYSPMFADSVVGSKSLYSFAIFRPRFSALTSISP